MRQPRVSIVIPVYNAEKYLAGCIESAVNQTYKETEIILVDDSSTDSGFEICKKWAEKDNRIKVIHKTNEGAGLARNAGLDAATGDYVLFVDSDDYILPETVQKCVDAAIRDDSEIVLYGRADVLPNAEIKEKTIKTDKFCYEGSDVTEELLASLCTRSKGFGFGVVCKMLKTSIIRDNGVEFCSEREVLSEDALFLAECFAYVKKATIVPEYLYMCVLHGDSLSNKQYPDFQSKNNVFLNKVTDICNKNGYSQNVKNHLTARYLSYALAGIKQVVASGKTNKESVAGIKILFKDELLCSALTNEVLSLCSSAAALFWKLFRLKCAFLCCLMIKFKEQN